jgi:hypothetical protein
MAQREDLHVFVPVALRQQPQQREHVRHTEVDQSQQHGRSPCHSIPPSYERPRRPLSHPSSALTQASSPTSMDAVFGRSRDHPVDLDRVRPAGWIQAVIDDPDQAASRSSRQSAATSGQRSTCEALWVPTSTASYPGAWNAKAPMKPVCPSNSTPSTVLVPVPSP